MYRKFLEPVVKTFTTGDYYKEVFQAKQEYFEKAGVVYEEDGEFESRMNIFMDWYIFERELPSYDLPPIKLYYRNNKELFSPEEHDVYKDFCATVHTIFYLLKINNHAIYVRDLFTKKKYEVSDSEINAGFQQGDIFEARLIPFKGTFQFSRGFCFHPVEMEKFILGEIKKVRFQEKTRQTKLILQLASMKLKHTRYQHINIKHIYTSEPKF